MDMMIKKVKLAELNINIATAFLNTQFFYNTNVSVVTKTISKSLI